MDLCNYLISDENVATEGEVLSGIASIAMLTIGCSIAQAITNRKQRKELEEKQKQADAKKREKEERDAAWKASPEYKQLEMRLKKKYGDPIHADFKKMVNSISKDISKIGSVFNRNKKQCEKWAESFLQYCKSLGYNESELDSYQDDANDVRTGPCAVPPRDYSGIYKNGAVISFAVIDGSQDVACWAGEELIPSICEALNAKYSDEIAYGILTEFEHGGDGDEGLVESSFKT